MLLYLNSKNRMNGNINNASYSIPAGLITTKSQEHIKITMVDFLCKKNWYNIESYNQSLTVTEDGVSHVVTIPTSSPNVFDLETDLATLLTSASVLYTYAVSYDPKTLNFTFTATPIGAVGTIDFVFSGNSCYEIMGFYNDTTNSFTPGMATLSLTSTRMADVGGEEAIYIHLDDFESPNVYVDKTSSIIGRVPLLVPSGSTVFYNNICSDHSVSIDKPFNNISIRITNENEALIEMQSSYSITLKIEIIDDTIDDTIENILKKSRDYLRLIVLQNGINKISSTNI